MRLADALDLPWEESFDEESLESLDLFNKLAEGALQFLVGGGRISLTDWCGFTQLEKEACSVAGQRRDAVFATSIGMAAQGAHASSLSPADGGDMLVKDTLSAVLDSMENPA